MDKKAAKEEAKRLKEEEKARKLREKEEAKRLKAEEKARAKQSKLESKLRHKSKSAGAGHNPYNKPPTESAVPAPSADEEVASSSPPADQIPAPAKQAQGSDDEFDADSFLGAMVGKAAISLTEAQKVVADDNIPESDPRKVQAKEVILKEANRLAEMAKSLQAVAGDVEPDPVLQDGKGKKGRFVEQDFPTPEPPKEPELKTEPAKPTASAPDSAPHITSDDGSDSGGPPVAATQPVQSAPKQDSKPAKSRPPPGQRLVQVDLIRGEKGFGMVLGSNGNGTFVTEVLPGGVAEKYFEEHGIDVVDGLRFKSIGEVDVFNSEKAIVKREMRLAAHALKIIFMREPDGFLELQSWIRADSIAVKPGDSQVYLVKGIDGFGLTVGSNGQGAYVTTAKEGSPAAMIFKQEGLEIGDGLRFKVIGEEYVYKASKETVLGHMRGAKLEMRVVFTKDFDGYMELPRDVRYPKSSLPAKSKSVSEKTEWKIELIKGSGGYGLVLAADLDKPGSGVFVRSIKPGSVAETVMNVWKLKASDGLRFKSVDGVDVLNAEKAKIVSMMRESTERLKLVFTKDPSGYASLPAATGVVTKDPSVEANIVPPTEESSEEKKEDEIIRKEDLPPDMTLDQAQEIVSSDLPRTDPKHIAARKVCLFAAQELERRVAAMGSPDYDNPPSPVEIKSYDFTPAAPAVEEQKPAPEPEVKVAEVVAVPPSQSSFSEQKAAAQVSTSEAEVATTAKPAISKINREYATEDERIRAEADPDASAARLAEVSFDFNFG